jgi:hypothetical protein
MTSVPKPQTNEAQNAGLHRLPAPHDRVEFRVDTYGVQYSGSAEDLISANVVTATMLKGKKPGSKMPVSGTRSRRHDLFGRVTVSYLKYGLVVIFREALERGVKLPGVTDEIVAAAKVKADAEWKDHEARCAAHHAPAVEEEDPDPNPIYQQLGRELGMLSAIADDDATAEDLVALMPEFRAKLLARKAKRGTERKRPDFLRLVVDNTTAARP